MKHIVRKLCENELINIYSYCDGTVELLFAELSLSLVIAPKSKKMEKILLKGKLGNYYSTLQYIASHG